MKTEKIRTTQLLTNQRVQKPLRSQDHFRQHSSVTRIDRSAININFSHPSALSDESNLVKSVGVRKGAESFTNMKALNEDEQDTTHISPM